MITVVVPTYNEERNIEQCLKSLTAQTLPREEIEIIVVDGGSKDRTREIAELLVDQVILQESEGVGGARNDGFKLARGEIVATTDADCKPLPDWLESITQSFRDPEVVAVTGTLVAFDFGEMSLFMKLVYRVVFTLSNLLLVFMSLFGRMHLCGANSAFRREPFLDVGGYLPLAYSDDIEIFKRIKGQGKTRLDTGMKVQYSVRRIRKVGLINYILLIARNEWKVMVAGKRPVNGNYARQNYE